jgi:hypothetical protein
MKRFSVLLGIIALCAGCTSADKLQWDEAMKELRGENIQMGSTSSATSQMNEQSFHRALQD